MQHTKKQGFSDVFQHSFGFSLVELIMTMAILAVVGIIGFTSFNGVTEKRENSRRVSDVEMFRNTVDTMVLQSGEVPEPTANRQFYKVSGAYAHSASGAVGVSSYLSPDILGKFAHADHPRDPKTGSFYGFGKSYSKKGEYQIAAVITGSDGPRALVQGRYTGGQGTNFWDIPGLVKAYNSSEFLIDGDSEWLPYNPTEKVVTASIIESSGSVQVSGGKPITAALMEGDILTVGTGSTATIKISDGTEAVIGSESNETIVTLSELALKDDTGLLTRVKLSLWSGRILAKAPKLREISEGERSDMQIESGGAVAAVRGTILGVDAGEGGSGKIRTVTLIEGKIQMIGSTGGDGGGNTGGGDVNGNTGNTEDGNPIRVYTSSVSGTPYPTSNSVSPTFSQSGVIEVQEGGNPISVSYVAQKSSAAGGNTSSDTGYTNPDIISSPPSWDTTALERVKQITASYTGTLAKLDQPSIAGKMIAPIHMSMTGSLGYSGGVGGAITSPTDGTVLTWANTVFTSNITWTSPWTGSMELRYETKVVGMSDVKVVVIGNIVQGAKLLTGTGGDNGVMYPENSEIAYRHVNKILRRLDPVYSGTGNIFIGDLSSITPTTSIVSGTTGNGYAYSGRTVHIPLKIDHNARTYSPDEKVSFMLCKKGENGVWCTKPYNVTVDAWMVGSAPLAYSRVGTKKMEMGMKVAEQVEDSTVSADSKECKNNGWSEEICAKTGNAGKDPTLVGITAFMGGCVTIQTPNGPTSTNSGDLNLYMLQSPGTHPRMIKANIMTDKVAKDKDTDSGDGGECTTASGTFSQGGIVLDRSALDDYLHYDVSSLIGAGKFRMEIEVNCADLFRLKASSTTNWNIYTLVQDSKDTTINITTGTLYGNKLNFPRFWTPGSTEKSSPLNLDDKCRVKIHRNTSNQYKTTIVNISNGSPIFSSTWTTIANFSGKFYIWWYKDWSYKWQWDAPIYSISIYNTD